MFILSRVNIATVVVAFWPMNQGGLLSDKLQEIHTSHIIKCTLDFTLFAWADYCFFKSCVHNLQCDGAAIVICIKAALLLYSWLGHVGVCYTCLSTMNRVTKKQQTTAILLSSCLFCLMFMFFVYGKFMYISQTIILPKIRSSFCPLQIACKMRFS